MNPLLTKLPICRIWKDLRLVTVFAAHEGFATAERVVEFCRDLSRQVCPECAVTRHVWHLHEFRAPNLKQAAAEEAAVADLVIFSLHHHEAVPHELKAWMDLWLTFKTGRPLVLVALLDPASARSSKVLERYFGDVARSENMEFVIHRQGTQFNTDVVPEMELGET